MRCDYTARSWGQHRAPSQGDFDPLPTTLTATIGDQPIQGITPNAKLYWYKKKKNGRTKRTWNMQLSLPQVPILQLLKTLLKASGGGRHLLPPARANRASECNCGSH